MMTVSPLLPFAVLCCAGVVAVRGQEHKFTAVPRPGQKTVPLHTQPATRPTTLTSTTPVTTFTKPATVPAEASVLGRLITPSSVAVVSVDVSSVQPAELQRWLEKLLGKAGVPAGRIGEMRSALRPTFTSWDNWAAGFTRVGGKRCLLVQELPLAGNTPYFLAPLGAIADSDSVVAQLELAEGLVTPAQGATSAPAVASPATGSSTRPTTRPSQPSSRVIESDLVYRGKGVPAALPSATPAPDDALVLLTSSPAGVVIFPAAARHTLKADPFAVLGQSVADEAPHANWLCLNVWLPPSPRLKLTLRADDVASAKRIADHFSTALHRVADKASEVLAGNEQLTPAELVQLTRDLQPTVLGDTVTISMEGESFERTALAALKLIQPAAGTTTRPAAESRPTSKP